MTALSALFEDALRPRVTGLFAVMWLLPSLAGPVLNAAIAVAVGWRWAMAWPAVMVVLGRLLIGRDAGMIPWRQSAAERLDLRNALVLLGGLMLAATAPAAPGGWGVAMLATGLSLSTVWSLRILRTQVRAQTVRFRLTAALYGLCLAFFGGAGIISPAAVDGLGRGAVAANVAVGVGLLAWSVTGMRSPALDARLGETTTGGLAVLAGALLVAYLADVDRMGLPPTHRGRRGDNDIASRVSTSSALTLE